MSAGCAGYRRCMDLLATVRAVVPTLVEQGRLIGLDSDRTIVFVGDTHGDIDATERIFERHLRPDRTIVFLGDAVDRGSDSEGNLGLILRTKLDRPTSVYFLMGNHEGWAVAPFSPADFWDRLEPGAERTVASALAHLPFAAWHPAGVLGLHGALPDLSSLTALESIDLGSPAWRAITWGDWSDETESSSEAWGRPAFGRAAFQRRAESLNVRVLVRSHQPLAPTMLYDERCLTIFSSNAYGDGTRRVAVLRPGTNVRTARDLDLEEIA